MDYKILLRKLKTGDHHLEPGWTGNGSVHAPIVLLLLWIWFQVKNEELRDKLNIFMAIDNTDTPVNQVEMTIVQLLKSSFQSNHQELLVQYFFQQEFSITEILIGTRSLK
jgi:DNA replication protein DnaD